MKRTNRRILARVLLALFLCPLLCLPVFAADTSLPGGYITQGTGGSKPFEYDYPSTYFDLEKELTQEDLTGADGYFLQLEGARSDFLERFIAANIDDGSHTFIGTGWTGASDWDPYVDWTRTPSMTEACRIEGLYTYDVYQPANLTVTKKDGGEDYHYEGHYGPSRMEEAYGITSTDRDGNPVYGNYIINYRVTMRCEVDLKNIVFERDGIYVDMEGTQWARGAISETLKQNAQTKEIPVEEQTISARKVPGVLFLDEASGYPMISFSSSDLTLYFRVMGVLPGAGGPVQSVTHQAEAEAGEDEGVDISTSIVEGRNETGGIGVPAAIAVGVGGAAAAAAGAAAATGSGSGSGDEKRKRYRMLVSKDFGDAIRRGGKPVTVRARIVEIDPSGAQRDRPDLNAKISVMSEELDVHSAALSGRYVEATVSAPENAEGNQATLTFIFDGPGGQFHNNIIFRLVDGPSLCFTYEEVPGQLTLTHENCGIDAIPGDGFTYSEKFVIADAVYEPELSDISATAAQGLDISFAKTGTPFCYQLTVKNNTPPGPKHDVFAQREERKFEITVLVKDEREPLKGYVSVYLYPEGITVDSDMKGEKKGVKYVRLQSYEKENAGALDRKWQASQMTVTFAVKGENRAIINPRSMEVHAEALRGAGGLGTTAAKEDTIVEKYKYTAGGTFLNDRYIFQVEPGSLLYEPDNGTFFMSILPVYAEYDGRRYDADIPLRLRGKDPDPMEEWNKEYEKTRSRIERFSLPGEKAVQLMKLEEIAVHDQLKISVTELRLMSKDIVRGYMEYWTEQHSKDEWNAKALDWAVWGLEWVKWIGDCAFSIVVSAYTGPLEAIISPAKDVLVSAIGEVGVNIVWGTKFNVENLEIAKAIKSAGDNFVSGGAAEGITWLASSGMSNPQQIKYACYIIGGYFVFAVFNNYLQQLEEGKNDFWGAIMSAFSDLTGLALKVAASMLFKKWLDSETFKEKTGPAIQKWMQKHFGDNLTDQKFNLEAEYNANQQTYGIFTLKDSILDVDVEVTRAGIVESYLTGLLGEGVSYCYDNPEKAQKRIFWRNPAGEFMFTFGIQLAAEAEESPAAVTTACDINLSKGLVNTSSQFFSWFYDLFFKGLPAAPAPIEIPKDPPLPQKS
ncbi:MAG: hypothetical protein IKQ92_03830 [Clostridia bacterium]|nr:hypothetical protein [Clostridia bacterium]